MKEKHSAICEICGKEFNSVKGLAQHVKTTHGIDKEDYYCSYVGSEKHCPICGKKARFISLVKGYDKTCGAQKCIDANNGINSDQQTIYNTCPICNKRFDKNFMWHMRKTHGLTPEEYYDKYIGEPQYCPVCGNKAQFGSIKSGYKKYCSYRCGQIDKGVDVDSEEYKRAHNCLICGEEDLSFLEKHLRKEHGITSNQEYYDKYHKTEGEGVCLECGKPTNFANMHIGYSIYCSKDCNNKSEISKKKAEATNLERYGCRNVFQNEFIKEKIKGTLVEKYGVEHSSQIPEAKEKTKKTCLERYGGHPLNDPEVRAKSKETCLSKYGTEFACQSEQVKQKIRETNQKHWGCDCAFESPIVKQKIRETNQAKYGAENVLASPMIREKIKLTNLSRYGYENPACSPVIQEKIQQTSLEVYGTDRPAQAQEVKEKIKQTNMERYGHPCASQSKEVMDKIVASRYANNTWGSSKPEEELYSLLSDLFDGDDLARSYQDPRYNNYRCDFYIKSRDLFIELNNHQTHMGHWFDENNPEDVSKLEEVKKNYKAACDTWLRDTQKRGFARQNNLNYVVFWRKEDFDLWVSLGCPDGKDYIKEYSWLPDRPTLNPFCEFPKELSPGTSICRAVAKAANGDSLFYRECEMWEENKLHKGVFLQPWLYANRLKYMDSHKNPEEITDAELIRGFTISGTIRGYSRYDVKPMKELLTEYRVKSVYDPCAGWGERLALCGALGISYEGVDINDKVVNGHNKIISHYKLGKNYSSTCDDSAKYTPKGSPDAVFTCPPYLAKEVYTDKGAENLSPEEFEEWWGEVCSNFPDSVQHVFVHIDEETKPHITTATEANGWKLIDDRYFSKKNASHFNRGKGGEIKKKNWESVLTFERYERS